MWRHRLAELGNVTETSDWSQCSCKSCTCSWRSYTSLVNRHYNAQSSSSSLLWFYDHLRCQNHRDHYHYHHQCCHHYHQFNSRWLWRLLTSRLCYLFFLLLRVYERPAYVPVTSLYFPYRAIQNGSMHFLLFLRIFPLKSDVSDTESGNCMLYKYRWYIQTNKLMNNK
jgi:hypothetical protein